MFKFSQCPLLCDIYILHILGSFFILELTKTLLRVKKKNHETTNLITKNITTRQMLWFSFYLINTFHLMNIVFYQELHV